MLKRENHAKKYTIDELSARFESCTEELQEYQAEENKCETALEEAANNLQTLVLYNTKVKDHMRKQEDRIKDLESALNAAGVALPAAREERDTAETEDMQDCCEVKIQLTRRLMDMEAICKPLSEIHKELLEDTKTVKQQLKERVQEVTDKEILIENLRSHLNQEKNKGTTESAQYCEQAEKKVPTPVLYSTQKW